MAFEFNPETHIYKNDGRVLPSVTQILKQVGVVDDTYYTDESANFGTYGHSVLKLALCNNLESYDPAIESWAIGIIKFIAEQKPIPFKNMVIENCTEKMVHDDRFAGTLDFVGNINKFPTRPCVLDWKFWSAANKNVLALAGLQTAAYAYLFKKEIGLKPLAIKRGVVHFSQNNYRIYELNDPADEPTFMSALNLVTWKGQHK